MPLRVHFLSGLPRSGSTLLAAILRQNPRFHAAMSGPLAQMFAELARSMSGANQYSLFISDEQRARILRSLVEAFYEHIPHGDLVFDNNRSWCALLPALVQLFPNCRVISTVRNPAWILDSIERQIQHNLLQPSRMFNHDPHGNVYTRAEMLAKGFMGGAMNNLRQAWFGEYANRLIVIRYTSLTERPADVIGRLYGLLDEPLFQHDFEHVEYEEPQVDADLGLPGFHKISGPVRSNSRDTILPQDLFNSYDKSFWDIPGQNPRGVTVL